jgi:hypothetical protein
MATEALLFWLDVLVRLAREKPLGITDLDCHAQHRKAALYPYGTSSCFVAGAFPGYCCLASICRAMLFPT